MEELLAKMEVCMATLDRIAAAGNSRAASDPGRSGVYVSMVQIDGKPILPPLVSSSYDIGSQSLYGNVTLIVMWMFHGLKSSDTFLPNLKFQQELRPAVEDSLKKKKKKRKQC